jgi:hypothetical protein
MKASTATPLQRAALRVLRAHMRKKLALPPARNAVQAHTRTSPAQPIAPHVTLDLPVSQVRRPARPALLVTAFMLTLRCVISVLLAHTAIQPELLRAIPAR